MTDGNGNVSISVYDGHDRPVKLRYPNATGGGTSSTDYEEVGYDAAGNVVSQRNRAGATTTIAYDALNRPTSLDAPSGTMDLAWTYDNLGRGLTATIGYDAAGNVVSQRNRAGATTTIAYDALNRPTSLDAPSGTMDLAWTYDNLGRGLTATNGGQTLTRSYDALSRQTGEYNTALGATGFQYDAAGRMTRITWPDSLYVQYDHDLYGAVTAIRENGATSGAGVLATYGYTNLGQVSGISRGNGVGTSYGYDSHGRMTSMAHDAGGSSNDVSFGYTWNPAGQIATRTVSNSAYVLAPVTGTTNYANDGLNRVTSAGASVSYDANQNITAALGDSFTYDAANRLTGTSSTTLTYDPADRLYSSSANGQLYLYAGDQLVAEYDTSGNLLAGTSPAPAWTCRSPA